ncbi:tyrosine-type recombinase/integrase [Bifidobacterium pseudolongum]|uniref:tyrosine-type recombinase/integrase n=1 Tax=Bifidobacterium pseudolongum TaxID=1694 RepID=UPI000C713917|nr:tyrosine-type recombinase/integrase [Bifidobacterium pseudolongum]
MEAKHQRYGDPSQAVIPKWLDATHLWGGLWLTTPKTAAGRRFVPLPDGLWQRLHNRIIRMHIDDHDLIFRTHLGRPVNDSNERRHFKTALAAAGLPDVKLYSARHWTATMTALADMPDDARIAIMGHTDPAMTRRYTHRPESSLAALLAQAIPDLGADMVEAEIIDETTK